MSSYDVLRLRIELDEVNAVREALRQHVGEFVIEEIAPRMLREVVQHGNTTYLLDGVPVLRLGPVELEFPNGKLGAGVIKYSRKIEMLTHSSNSA